MLSREKGFFNRQNSEKASLTSKDFRFTSFESLLFLDFSIVPRWVVRKVESEVSLTSVQFRRKEIFF